jgi:Tol biopolymer transport system component
VAVGSGGSPQGAPERIAAVSQSASAPRFAPGYIAYVSNGGARRGIWKYANGTATELWGDATADRVGAPSISPDGRRIAFIVERLGATQ